MKETKDVLFNLLSFWALKYSIINFISLTQYRRKTVLREWLADLKLTTRIGLYLLTDL